MKLYLSSYRIPTPEDLFGLFEKSAMQCRMAIIPNAKDDLLPEVRAQKLDEVIYDVAKFGFVAEVIDLREYEDPALLKQTLQQYDGIWAAGGNCFVLRSEMRRSGLEQIVRELVDGGMVYCGESAGAMVAGLSLQGAEIGDNPDSADELIYEGLELIDKIIVPHADSPDFVEYLNHMKKTYQNDDRVVYLRNDQALIASENSTRLSQLASNA